MDVAEARSRYWRLVNLMQQQGQITPTLDRQIALAQLELLTEATVQLIEINSVLKRVGIINFEELALRLEDFFRKT